MNFFKYFPGVPYVFTSGSSTYHFTLTNTSVHFKIIERLKQNITVFYDYVVQDGDRPDTVAYHVYGDVQYTWLVLMLNNIFTLYDWPLTQSEFDDYITEKYGSPAAAQAIYTYSTATGFLVDALTYATLDAANQGVPVSAYDTDLALNEAKRRIRVVPPEFASLLQTELKAALKF